MREYKLNKNEISESFPGCNNLQQIVSDIEKSLWEKNTVLCQLSVNGEWLTEEQELKLKNKSSRDIFEIQYQAKPLLSLVKENLSALIDWLEHSRVAINTAIEFVDQGQVDEFNQNILSIYDGCQWFVDSITFLRTPITQLDCELVDMDEWQKLTREFIVVMKQCLLAFEQQDTQALIDLMGYRLSDNFDKWLVLLQSQDKMIQGD